MGCEGTLKETVEEMGQTPFTPLNWSPLVIMAVVLAEYLEYIAAYWNIGTRTIK